jgi:hypothetical protein
MPVEIALNTPLADALNSAIQPKLAEVGWGSGGADDAALAEYIVLMLVNGKTQEEIATELSGELLGLGTDDPGAREFARWLFEQIDQLNAQYNVTAAAQPAEEEGAMETTLDDTAMGGNFDADMNVLEDGPAQLNAYDPKAPIRTDEHLLTPSRPTGPKAMRSGSGMRGGREKRLMGQITRAMDRSHEPVLHRVRLTSLERISRTPPVGPRMGVGRQPRIASSRGASVAAGVAAMGGIHGASQGVHGGMNGMNGMSGMSGMNGMNGMNGWMMPGQQQHAQMDIYAMLQQQSRMMQQMQQQMMMQQGGAGSNSGFSANQGKPLSDRIQRPHNGFRRGGGHHQSSPASQPPEAAKAETDGTGEGEDVEMSLDKREPANPEESICKYNLRCTNKDCKYAHQSPAALPGTAVDVKDVCSFGAACKNRKCVGRHPSPATKAAHQGEQDCKFYPNCTNPQCPFRHPTMPPCRNGGECKVPNCKFTHIKTMCKYHPCTNRFCPFTHEEGQRGTFQDKVWTAEDAKEDHVSERKFVDDKAPEDVIISGDDILVS